MKVKTTQRYLPTWDSSTSFLQLRAWHSGKKQVCAERINEVFDIPSGATKLWFTFHTRPHEDRVKLALKVGEDDTYPNLTVDGEVPGWYLRTYEYVKKLIDKHGTLHVECHYEN